MNWMQMEGQWHQLTGQVKSTWGKLTDDDVKDISGKKDQLIGKLQERYGVLKAEAEKQVNEWLGNISPTFTQGPRHSEPPVQAKSPTDEHASPSLLAIVQSVFRGRPC